MSTSLRPFIGGSVVAGALLLTTLIPAQGAGAARVAIDDQPAALASARMYYGALALSQADGAVGWAYDYRTKARAGKAALRECKKASDTPWSCRKIVWVRNGCVALAVLRNGDGSIARYTWGFGISKARAYRKALNKCGPGCERRVWTCTTR